jgi:uncharacterized membrane protein
MAMSERVPNPLARLDDAEELDGVVDVLDEKLSATIPGDLHDLLRGESWLGHRLHPLLTDVTIGAFASALLLDFLGGRGSGKAAQRLIALGIVSSLPTAAAGVADWLDGSRQVKRTGVVHAALNNVALLLFVRSWSRRRRGYRLRGMAYSLLGATALSAGGYLGGHLTYKLGSGVQEPTETDGEPGYEGRAEVAGEADARVDFAVVEVDMVIDAEEPLIPPTPTDPRIL